MTPLSHKDGVSSVHPYRYCWLDAATMSLLSRCSQSSFLLRCSHNEEVGSMQPQRDWYLHATTTRLFPRHNRKKGVGLDATTTKLFPRCRHSEHLCSHNEGIASMKPKEDNTTQVFCPNASITSLLPRCSHNEGVGAMKTFMPH